MNTPHRPGKEPDDHDIAALFDAQPLSLPEELDATILAAAKKVITESPSTAESKFTIKPLSKTTNRWFALAATVVVGVSVAPLLLKSPESSLNAPSVVSSVATSSAPAEVIAEKEIAGPAPLIASDDNGDDNGGAAGDLLLEERESLAVSDESVTADVTAKTIQSSTARIASPAASSATSLAASSALMSESDRTLEKTANYDYRNTPDAWVKEILRLESTGNNKQASVEYELFRDKHPDVEPEFKLRSLKNEPVKDDKP